MVRAGSVDICSAVGLSGISYGGECLGSESFNYLKFTSRVGTFRDMIAVVILLR